MAVLHLKQLKMLQTMAVLHLKIKHSHHKIICCERDCRKNEVSAQGGRPQPPGFGDEISVLSLLTTKINSCNTSVKKYYRKIKKNLGKYKCTYTCKYMSYHVL
jgi:hypothetical protein